MRFTKMHGCGNDYVYVDAWSESLPADIPALAMAVSDRHRGIGADGLIVIGPGRDGGDARMRMWNADGSESEMCGNGIRCAAKLAWDHGRLGGNRAPRVETGAGLLRVELRFAAGGGCDGASVSMGRPRLLPAQVPVALPGPDLVLERQGLRLRAVGMGNPHAVAVVPDPDAFPVAEVGPRIEHDPVFPRRTNVEFTARLPDEGGLPVIRQRTWERGSGITLACGTGACAVTVAWIIDRGIAAREVIVRLDGGDLRIAWPADDAEVRMTGEAVSVFEGAW
ncbi:MAG: diaminopimelate epimerase [Planctomycetes bacterium]|nr:diaminopimelate epimerase [Planctomycetota bacterium]